MGDIVEVKLADFNLNTVFDYPADLLTTRNKRTYDEYMTEYEEQYASSFQKLAESVEEATDKKAYINGIADAFAKLELEKMNGLNKYKSEQRRIDTRMYMVMFMLPRIAEQQNSNGKLIADRIVAIWPEMLGGPKTFGYTSSASIGDRFGGDWLSRLTRIFNGGAFGKKE